MTDLSLYEYRDMPEDLLKAMLREEKKMISGTDLPRITVAKKRRFILPSLLRHIPEIPPFLSVRRLIAR